MKIKWDENKNRIYKRWYELIKNLEILSNNDEQALKDLLALTKNEDAIIRWFAAISVSIVANNYINEKNYEKAFHCFYGVAASFKYGFWEHIRPRIGFYRYQSLGLYYQGRALVIGLSEIESPKNYEKNLKNAMILFDKSNKLMERRPLKYEPEARILPICLNIYSAYYEYNLSLQKLDEKNANKIQNYLNKASKQCEIVGTEKGSNIVKIFEKLTETLKTRINEMKLETEKRDSSIKGKGVGERGTYDTYIKKSRKDFEKHLFELDNLLNELEIPLIKKIIEFEKNRLDEIKSEEEDILIPKSSWVQAIYNIFKIIKNFWKIIVIIGLILATIVGIIENWHFILGLIKI